MLAHVVVHDGTGGSFLVQDLSATGALLIGERSVSPDEEFLVVLRLDEYDRVAMLATRVRSEVDGPNWRIAVAFHHPNDVPLRLVHYVESELERSRIVSQDVILVADEDAVARMELERAMESLALRCVTAATPLEVVHHAEHATVIVAFVDLQFGGARGPEVLAFLADEHPGAYRIGLSDCVDDLNAAVSTGQIQTALAKPWDRAGLIDVLELHR